MTIMEGAHDRFRQRLKLAIVYHILPAAAPCMMLAATWCEELQRVYQLTSRRNLCLQQQWAYIRAGQQIGQGITSNRRA